MVKQDPPQGIRTRIAPSPTGEDIHIGTLQTALFNFAVARKNKGKFVVRIEDTDRLRFIEGAEEKYFKTLKSYQIIHDEGPDIGGKLGPYRQSERLEIYKKHAEDLISKGTAYYCFCTKERLLELREQQVKEKKQTKYDKYCLNNIKNALERVAKGETHVIRLNVKSGSKVEFTDLIRGQIAIDSAEIDDQVLLKSDGFPTYHLAVVVDDYYMRITYIIRGEEWISSTPKHILLYNSFGWELPIFAHTPLLRNPDKSKMSKRRNPVWASWYIEQGFLPEAMLNYLALLGWSHPEEKEIFPITEFIELFNLKDLKPVGPIFDVTKLKWMNQQYIQNKSDGQLKDAIVNFSDSARNLSDNVLESLMPLLKSRMETLCDFQSLTEIFFDSYPEINFENNEKEIAAELYINFEKSKDWNSEIIFGLIQKTMKNYKVRMPIIYKILTGREKGLPLPESLNILGKEKTLKRLSLVQKV